MAMAWSIEPEATSSSVISVARLADAGGSLAIGTGEHPVGGGHALLSAPARLPAVGRLGASQNSHSVPEDGW